LGKSRQKKVWKKLFYFHTNIVTKKWEEKNARYNFSSNTRIVRAINVGKNSSENVWKKTFLFSHEYRDQKRGKTARNNFSSNRRIVRAINFGKKSSEKSVKKPFLFSHEYRDQKMGGKKREIQFFQQHTNSASNKCWEKFVGKSAKKRF